MQYRRIIFILPIIAVLFFFSCDNSTGPTHNEPLTFEENLALSPRPDAEAEEMALYLSGDLVAPQELYQRIKFALRTLRREYADSIPAVNNHFRSIIITSTFEIVFTNEAVDSIHAGSYSMWDSLNEYYSGMLDTSFLWAWSEWHIGDLHFRPRLNPIKLYDEYKNIDNLGVIRPRDPIGDAPNIYPWLDDDSSLIFVVRDAWGDCPSGCLENHFYLFKETHRSFKLMWDGGFDDAGSSALGAQALQIYNYFDFYFYNWPAPLYP